MITENLSTLKIHKLTQAQYDRELANGTIDNSALYLTPEEEIDLSPYAKKDEVSSTYETKASADSKLTEAKTYTDTIAEGKANSSHNHSASNITSGTLSSDRLPTVPITKGGTGATTAASALTNLGITATASELNKMDGVTATTTELNYVDGVTSNIQTQLNAKQATITGGATTIATSNLTASRALVSNSSGKVAVSAVTSTELGYLDGVTSAIQTQLDTKAASDHTHDGYMSSTDPVGTGSLSMNRKSGTTVGTYSVALGYNCEASGKYSYVSGINNVASGFASHAEGGTSSVSTSSSGNVASGENSHAEGRFTTASGIAAHSEGINTTASGNYSHAEGNKTTALTSQHAQGHYNNTSNATAGSLTGTTGSAFIIGNGTSSTDSNAFRVSYAGQVIGKSAYSSSGADYAEYFEWADGNLNNEERIGYFVTFEDGRFIRKANEGEYILGIVSGNPAVLGNHDECWMGQNEMDEWGRFVYVTETEVDEETGETYEYQTYKVNPDYDNTIQYIPRADRSEWDTVGMLGVLSVRDDGTCKVNEYCKVANGGIATASDTGYRVIKRVTDNIIKVVFR